jgi:hypothetical protein
VDNDSCADEQRLAGLDAAGPQEDTVLEPLTIGKLTLAEGLDDSQSDDQRKALLAAAKQVNLGEKTSGGIHATEITVPPSSG